MLLRSGWLTAVRKPRALVAAAMMATSIAICVALLMGSAASASCHSDGYGGTVCTHHKTPHHNKHHPKKHHHK